MYVAAAGVGCHREVSGGGDLGCVTPDQVLAANEGTPGKSFG